MGVDNTWSETSAPMSMHPPPAPEETLSLFTYPSRHTTSPSSPIRAESASQQYAIGWDTKQTAPPCPETPPPSDVEHFGEQHMSSINPLDAFYTSAQVLQDYGKSKALGATDIDSSYSAQYLQDDIEDSCAAPGVCGLQNLGNTCFMSAGIQCLSNTPTLLHFFLHGSQIETIPEDSLTAQFSHLLRQLWSGRMKVFQPADFKRALGSTYPQFKDYRQHDCQEFLALLLDSLHEHLNAANLSNGLKMEVKSQSVCSTSVSTMLPYIPPKLLHEKNEFPVKNNSVPSTSNLNYYLKDSKTSNVNVAVEDEETNNSIKFDSEKYHRNDLTIKQRDTHPKHNLASTYDFDHKTVSTKRLKEINCLQDRPASGTASGDGLDFKRIKLTDQNNCCKDNSGVQDCDVSGSVGYGNVETHKHSNNSLLSIVNGINKVVNDKSSMCDDSNDEQSSKVESSDDSDEPNTAKEDVEADEHWQEHLALNQSVVVDSFLGQFKSTVICSQCKHISVTHEPFMYLSVPLPHAMERQIKVTFVPAFEAVAVEYLVTVNKQDSVRQLGEAVIALRSSESHQLSPGATVVMAEGFPCRISKTLDDSMPLRHVNYRNRQIYAIETLPPPPGCSPESPDLEVPSNEDLDFPSCSRERIMAWYSTLLPPHNQRDDTSDSELPGSYTAKKLSEEACAVASSEDLDYPSFSNERIMSSYSTVLSLSSNSNNNRDETSDSEIACLFPAKTLSEETCAPNSDVDMMCLPDSSTSDHFRADWDLCMDKPCTATSEDVPFSNPIIDTWVGHTTPPPLEDADFLAGDRSLERREPELSRSLSSECSTRSAMDSSDPVFPKPFDASNEQGEELNMRSEFHGPDLPRADLPRADSGLELWRGIVPRNKLKSRMGYNSGSPDRIDDCKQCAICLEEATKDMRRHVGCNIILCDNCIENAHKHHGVKDELECPGCRKVVFYDREFIRIDKLGDLKPAIRELTVPLVFRLDTEGDGNNNQKTYELFGFPKVLKLPSTLPAKELDCAVKRLVPTDQPYTLLTVDGKGDRCSRCLYNNHCRGCRIASDGEVTLRSGDTLAVRFTEEVESEVRKHPSLKLQRLPDNKSLTLYDCLKAFSESELLDEHNPWFCPTCKKNQCATKTLSVCRYPDLLIVYLKRFVFHNGISTKLDNKVKYPLNNLIINKQSPHLKEEIAYDLYACVCHVGGISAGHYTAYAKNPINSEWYYFNDDNVIRQRPQEEDYSNGYILFYQKQGVSFPEINVCDSVKINQILEEFVSADNEDIVRKSMMGDDDDTVGERKDF